MYHSKPYTLDYRKPENAEEILKKLTEAIPAYIGPDEHYIIGFLDNLHHKQRQIRNDYGHLKKHLMVKNTDYIKANAFAFYSINGSNFIDFMESSKTENVYEFLIKIVEQNPGKRIIIFLDNSKSHHADKTIRKPES